MNTKSQSIIGNLRRTLLVVLAFTVAAHAQTETVLFDFNGNTEGAEPPSGLVADSAGNLYGTTQWGGSYTSCSTGCGVVYELSRTSSGAWEQTILHTFGAFGDGAEPAAGLVVDRAGNLYGTTTLGGSRLLGTVFELTPTAGGTWQSSILWSFLGGSDGANPQASLYLDSAGDLFGTTAVGGASGGGTVFKLTPSPGGQWNKTVLYGFNGSDGSYPTAGVIPGPNGSFYGTTYSGGTLADGQPAHGTVFWLTPASSGWKETVLHAFTGGKDGFGPQAGLAADVEGNLFGTTFLGGYPGVCIGRNNGCGTAYELSPAAGGGWTFNLIHVFTGGPDGGGPYAGLTPGPDGSVYGTAFFGGTFCTVSCGLVFQFVPSDAGWQEVVLHDFSDGSDGGAPQGTLLIDGAGQLFGTTSTGGSAYLGWGTAFEIAP